MEHTFSVDVRGLIDLLGRRLHNEPSFLIRDLIQSAGNSIRAREALDADYSGSIVIEAMFGNALTLAFLDNGIGLTEDEAHRTLGTLGPSNLELLSSFCVTDEIAVISRSARPGSHPTIEWRGRADGRYSLRTLNRDIQPGTQIYVTFHPKYNQIFTFDYLLEQTREFTECFAYPIRLVRGEESIDVVRSASPWRRRFTSTEQQTRELLAFGVQVFDSRFLDAIPFESKVGEIEGVAYVLAYSADLITPDHYVCWNEIRLGETVDWMLPDWANFVSCIVNIRGLQPTTSRESLIETDAFDEIRETIGHCLRDYLVGVAARDTKKLSILLEEHEVCLKTLALEDDEFFRLMIDWVVFETSMGFMTLGDYRERYSKVLYVKYESDFRWISPIASARGDCVIWADSDFEVELLDRLPILVEGAESEAQDLVAWGKAIKKSDARENLAYRPFADRAEEILRSYGCRVDVESHRPGDPPARYHPAIEPLEAETLEMLQSEYPDVPLESYPPFPPSLTLNSRHPLIRELASSQDRAIQSQVIEGLYLQAMLAGRYPLGPREMAIINSGLIDMFKALAAR